MNSWGISCICTCMYLCYHMHAHIYVCLCVILPFSTKKTAETVTNSVAMNTPSTRFLFLDIIFKWKNNNTMKGLLKKMADSWSEVRSIQNELTVFWYSREQGRCHRWVGSCQKDSGANSYGLLLDKAGTVYTSKRITAMNFNISNMFKPMDS